MTRYTVHFSGRVQGVGFRYTTVRIARRFKVAGYVRNLADGGVELVVEGEPAEADALFRAIREQMSGYITADTVDPSAATGEFGQPGARALDVRY